MFRRSWKTKMTDSERQRGWVFFGLYLLVFPYLNAWVQRVLMGDGEPLVAEANVLYYSFLFALALLVFWSFLKRDFADLLDWLPENLFGIAVGLAGTLLLRHVLARIPLPVTDPVPCQYAAQLAIAPAPTLALTLLLIPVAEECLYRGLIFGSLRRYSLPLAYGVSVIGYALACVWRYAVEAGDPRYLLLAVLYLPVSAALTWCYDNGGSVWSAVALHAAINGCILMGVLR